MQCTALSGCGFGIHYADDPGAGQGHEAAHRSLQPGLQIGTRSFPTVAAHAGVALGSSNNGYTFKPLLWKSNMINIHTKLCTLTPDVRLLWPIQL